MRVQAPSGVPNSWVARWGGAEIPNLGLQGSIPWRPAKHWDVVIPFATECLLDRLRQEP